MGTVKEMPKIFGNHLPEREDLIEELVAKARSSAHTGVLPEVQASRTDEIAALCTIVAAWSKELALPISDPEQALLVQCVTYLTMMKIISAGEGQVELYNHWINA